MAFGLPTSQGWVGAGEGCEGVSVWVGLSSGRPSYEMSEKDGLVICRLVI